MEGEIAWLPIREDGSLQILLNRDQAQAQPNPVATAMVRALADPAMAPNFSLRGLVAILHAPTRPHRIIKDHYEDVPAVLPPHLLGAIVDAYAATTSQGQVPSRRADADNEGQVPQEVKP